MPPLVMDWLIHRIELRQGPLITRNGLPDFDPAQVRSIDVQNTGEGEDFLLHCELVSTVPRDPLMPG